MPSLIKTEDGKPADPLSVNAGIVKTVRPFFSDNFLDFNLKCQRKIATCSRCKTVMYPGRPGAPENHKKGVCADGVRQKPKPESTDVSLPEWPQPHGIFTNGSHFDPLRFLLMVRELYDKVVAGSVSDLDYSMEDEAFSQMLSSRIVMRNSCVLFRLFDLENAPETPALLFVEVEGVKYLRVDCLAETPNLPT